MASSTQAEVARPTAHPSLEDTTLVHLARSSDHHAFVELCQRHSWTAWEIAYAVTGDEGASAEAVAEAFTRLFKPGRSLRYDDSDAVQTAILSTTRTSAIETVRRAGRDGVDGAYDMGGSKVQPTLARRGLPIVSAAFRSLPERWRSVLWLIEVHGVNPRTAGAALGVSANGLAQLITRSRTGLRERYLQAHIQAHVAEACRPVVEHLAAYVTREITPQGAARIDSHLDRCVDCKQRLMDLDDLGGMLRTLEVPIPMTLTAKALSRWKLQTSAASSVERPAMSLVPFPNFARKPLAGAALGVLGMGIIGVAVVGGPLLNHGLGGSGIPPAAASPSEVNQPFQIGSAFANNRLGVGAGALAALSGAPTGASPTSANPLAAVPAAGAPSTPGSPPSPPPNQSPTTTTTLPFTVPTTPNPPPTTAPTLPPPLGNPGTTLPPPLGNPGTTLPPPPVTLPPATLPPATLPPAPPPPSPLPLSTTLPTLP